jgi:hypothetical protein
LVLAMVLLPFLDSRAMMQLLRLSSRDRKTRESEDRRDSLLL